MRIAALLIASLFGGSLHAEEASVLRKMSENKFVSAEGLPSCVTMAVQQGDPNKDRSVILIKGKAGCLIPWHWHSANEDLMMASGSAKLEMKAEGKSAVLAPGSYARLPSKHVHQMACQSACSAFVSSDAPFDIHYVDASGKEIPPEAAVAKKK
jgi:quercetin dioxygenase-like cupin family protein